MFEFPHSFQPYRPRHLCFQTREVLGRVCTYFREFAKRFSALGNNITGTPFENPDRMASHATGFTIPTIRRCGERMEAVPLCTYRPGSSLFSLLLKGFNLLNAFLFLLIYEVLLQDEELSNLSVTFSDEPWFANSKGRARPMPTIRRRPRKRSLLSLVSTSEAEVSELVSRFTTVKDSKRRLML
uniref:Uncharacterized protein n=1 Tax=Angiostrongylus cantonensis TaxID=6313 RepID=A0A0K0DHB0_ANGCA